MHDIDGTELSHQCSMSMTSADKICCMWPTPMQVKALKTLAAMCAQLISAMGTKLEDDRRLLQSDGMSDNAQLAIRFRIQLKVFIQAALALVLNKFKGLQSMQT